MALTTEAGVSDCLFEPLSSRGEQAFATDTLDDRNAQIAAIR
jgi:hypothetical protein